MSGTPLFTSQQASAIDADFVANNPQEGFDLMRRAGRRIADLVLERFAGCDRVVVFCGGGNNGGDGYVAANRLLEAGISVRVVAVSAPTSESCKRAAAGFAASGGETTEDFDALHHAGLIIDAMLGAGLSQAPRERFAEAIQRCNAASVPILAVDLPSGTNGSTGGAYDPSIRANMTVTFVVRKIGLYTGPGRGLAGTVVFDDLGVDPACAGNPSPGARLMDAPRFPQRDQDSHKGQFGHVVIVGGEAGMPGAVILAGRAALRGGAGLVTVATDPAHLQMIPIAQPELMTVGLEEGAQFESLLNGADLIVCGPGMGAGEATQQLIARCLESGKAGVIDAGALRALGVTGAAATGFVLTPHPGEAAALLGCRSSEVQQDRCRAARTIAIEYDCVAVLKGSGTVVSDGDRIRVCNEGNPGMATAGMGDVLAGLTGAFIAQGQPPFEAACAAVYLHAGVADRAAAAGSMRALIASDIINGLSTALAD